VVGVDVYSYSSTLGPQSTAPIQRELTMVAFNIFDIGHTSYSMIRFSLNSVIRKDSWISDFSPLAASQTFFLKLKDYVPVGKKQYGDDGFNGNANNTLGTNMPDMVGYFNFFLSEDIVTTTR